MSKLSLLAVLVLLFGLSVIPVYAQAEPTAQTNTLDIHWLAVGMAIAAAGCGYAQGRAVHGACDGVSRNPGAVGTIRFFFILGLAFIEFLALLTFVVVLLLLP